ncbi:MAG: transposase [Akkermansia sp.]
MGRLPRRKLGRGVYHVYNRSANDMWILDDDEMKEIFLNLVKRFAQKYKLNIYHYCVMSNHFHFAIEGDIHDISSLFRSVCSRYTIQYHAMTHGHGSIWQPRYKSVLVQKEGYLSRLGRYIELNPVRAKMVAASQLLNYPWSSARCYLSGEADELVDPLNHPYRLHLEEYGEAAKRRYAEYLNVPYEEDLSLFRSILSHIGDADFLSSVICVVGKRMKLKVGRPRKIT